MSKRLLPLAVLLAFSALAPARAALFDDEEARRQISLLRTEVNARIERLEASSRGQLELANQNELLRAEIARLNGQIELLTHEVQTLTQRQRDFYVDLDNRMRQLETAATATPPIDPAAESRDYEAALALLKESQFKEAQAGFDQFINRYPGSNFLPNAHFWAGNAALQAKDVGAAASYFRTILNKWPSDPIAPDAVLGVANAQQAMGEAKAAQDTLKKLVEQFPDSAAAKVARQRLGLKP